MHAFKLIISKMLLIEYDNAQTICFLINKSIKFQIKLWHVDIHSYWLKQEIQCKSIYICWVSTKEMVADDLTKALLSTQKHNFFVKMTDIKDQKKLLASIKKEENNAF